MADFLDFARAKLLEHFCGVVFAEGNEQRGALFEAFFRASCH
jgi:hypothetical protein